MALEYKLTLAGSTPQQVAERAFPDMADRPPGTTPLLTMDLYESYGFHIAVMAGENGYLSAESDNGLWEWEPKTYVSVTFSLDKSADRRWAVQNVLTTVERVLSTGAEDAALTLNADFLLLTRFGGVLVRHRREWWDSYPGADV